MPNAFAMNQIFAVRCNEPLPCTFLCRADSFVVAVNRIFACARVYLSRDQDLCRAFLFMHTAKKSLLAETHGKKRLHGDAYFSRSV
jgi:hypothetical protein